MTAERTLLDSGQVALRLRMSRESFLRKRKALEAAHGFPPRVPGCGNHWDPVALDLWLDRQIPGHLHETRIEADTRPGAVNWIDRHTGALIREAPDVEEILRGRIHKAVGLVEN